MLETMFEFSIRILQKKYRKWDAFILFGLTVRSNPLKVNV